MLFGITVVLLMFLIIIPSSFALNESDISNFTLDADSSDNQVLSLSNDDNLIGVDYYFDVSADENGDGSEDSPYNELTLGKIKASSTIHLANGVYELKNGKTLSKVTIIGQDAEKTIIKYTGTGKSGVFSVGVDNNLVLQNVTLIGFNFDLEGGIIQASNTIFKNAVAPSQESGSTNLVNSAVNSFGGVIYAYDYYTYGSRSLPTVILENCTFINNTAEYGGAVFMNLGTLDITDCNFINNYAYNYGGALVGLTDASVRIRNTKFVNDTSLNDAGGAIYLFKSYLSANNVEIINCSSTFGSAITALNSTTAIGNLKAINNTARYEGGAIYQMYGGLTITDSEFINNTARNGGAVYVDDISIFELTYNNFKDNKAIVTGGAVYLLLVRGSTINNNNYSGNKANSYDDLYKTDKVNLFVGSGNYTLILNNDTFDGVFPSYYDLRELGYVTSVKDQQSGGNCWAFASMAALESAILKASGLNLDLSEEHMKNIAEIYSDYGWLMETNEGGYPDMAVGYLTSWLGPVLEDDEEYDDYSMLSPITDSFTHVQNIVFLPRSSYTDNDGIKEALMRYGAVQTGIYYDSTYYSSTKKSYYYYGSGSANHAVAIVGWDDNYSKDNFLYKPNGDGAWIVKNSWNEDWGDKGYFYVSYYDTRLAEIGDREVSYAFVFNDSQRYDKNYQYDLIGKTDYLVTSNPTVWVQNVFESTNNELLAAVSTYFRKITDFELFVYVNDELAITQSGTCRPGYTTIQLNELVPLSSGDKFNIVFKLSCDNEAEFAISEIIRAAKLTYTTGVSFLSFDGENWTDLYDYKNVTELDGGHTYESQVAAIKAFTILYELHPSIELNVSSINYNEATILAIIHDQYGNLIRSGNVTFTIEGCNYTAKVINSIANLTHVFTDIGSHVINVTYKNSHKNITVDISRININLNSSIVLDKNSAVINLISLFNVNTTVNLVINDKSQEISLIDGIFNLTLTELDYGQYNVSANVNDDVYAGSLNSTFFIEVSKTVLVADDLISYYSFENPYSVILKDIYGNPVVNRQVSFISNGKSYAATTDDKGIASTVIKVDDNIKSYKVNVLFYGDNEYFASNLTINGEVRQTINFLNSDYLVNSKYEAIILDRNGNPLTKTQVNVIIDNNDNWVITDNDGKLSFNIDLKTGNHAVFIKNPATGEILSQDINVVSRIMENKNMNVYFLSGSVYKIRVYGDDAAPAGANEVVKIVVNKKTYNVKTNSEGYATFNLNNLKPGSYTLTATYSGVKVSNKIVIKPVLITKNVSKKKAKTVKYTAKLVNTKGKVVKGKKITFKVNGKAYTAKTNAKGIATVSITNLKVGKNTITTKYSKSTNKNTITIKK